MSPASLILQLFSLSLSEVRTSSIEMRARTLRHLLHIYFHIPPSIFNILIAFLESKKRTHDENALQNNTCDVVHMYRIVSTTCTYIHYKTKHVGLTTTTKRKRGSNQRKRQNYQVLSLFQDFCFSKKYPGCGVL